jgi:hypothetical protein
MSPAAEEFHLAPGLAASRASAVTPALAASFRPNEDTIFVDVGERVIDSNVIRDGVKVGVFELDPDRFEEIFTGRPIVRQRVVSQSIRPGTPVPAGTTVDLIMAETTRLPVGVIPGVLEAIRDDPMEDIYSRVVTGHEDVANRILARIGPDNVLPPAEQEQLAVLFEQADLPLSDEPGNDVAAAVETLRAVFTFGG